MRRQRAHSLLIATKLNRPAIDGNWVQRPRLIFRLNEGLKTRLTLISTPAGFGKTTLAVQWLAQLSAQSAWLSLDPHDDDPERFLRYLVAALQSAVPGVCTNVEPLLSVEALPPPAYVADALVAELSALTEPVVLVLDDYQAVAAEALQTMVMRLVQYLPETLHLVCLSRVDPSWPLGLWRARQWLNELRAADLGFSRPEAQAYFAQYATSPLAADMVDLLHRRTEGWVTGLRLAHLSLSMAEDPEQFARDFSGSDRLIVDYLMHEVVAHQPADLQEFLAVSALLERFCAPLCDFMLEAAPESTHSSRLIARLETANLFLVGLDSERQWYRYHQLFHELLTRHLDAALSPERQAQLHHRAGEWFAAQGLVDEALRHLLAAGKVDAAAALVEEHLHAIIDADLPRQTLGRWLEMFPPSAETQRPGLLMAQAYRKAFNWDLRGATQLLDHIDALLQEPGLYLSEASRARLQGDMHAMRAMYLWWQGEPKAALRHGLQALTAVPRDHRYVSSVAVVYTAAAYTSLGQRDAALRLLADALLQDRAADGHEAGHLLAGRTGILLFVGDLAAVQDSATQMLAIHETVPIPDYWYGYVPYFLGRVAYERNRLETAADHFGQVEQMRYRVNTRLYHDSLLGLALVACARGETDKARTYASLAQSFAIETHDTYSMHLSDSFTTRLAMRSGETQAQPADAASTLDCHRFWLEIPSLTRAEYLVSQATVADCQAGLQCIEDAIQQAEQYHNTWQTLQLLALKAVALHGAGQADEALDILEQTLHMAEPLGLVRTFVDRGPIMAVLLKTLVARHPATPYARRLLEACESTASAPALRYAEADSPAAASLPDGLSNREIDVLLMLAARLSNKEIAARLCVSSETVKKHAANLYRKLHVHGRRQAVAVARQRGLLPET